MPRRRRAGSREGSPEADDIRLLKSSYDRLWKLREEASAAFYARLFEIAPETQRLFKNDMAEQQRKFMASLGYIVTHIDMPDVVTSALEASARRHDDYGVELKHYDQVGEALIWTIDRYLGPRYVPVWTATYARIAEIMRRVSARSG